MFFVANLPFPISIYNLQCKKVFEDATKDLFASVVGVAAVAVEPFPRGPGSSEVVVPDAVHIEEFDV